MNAACAFWMRRGRAHFVSLNKVNAGTALSVDLGDGNDMLAVTNSTANAGVTASLIGGAGTSDSLSLTGNTFANVTNTGFEVTA
jgi:hypothetical protein